MPGLLHCRHWNGWGWKPQPEPLPAPHRSIAHVGSAGCASPLATHDVCLGSGALVEDVAADTEFEAAAAVVTFGSSNAMIAVSMVHPACFEARLKTLMRNAAHYTPDGSEVEVSLAVLPGSADSDDSHRTATLENPDFGPGVP